MKNFLLAQPLLLFIVGVSLLCVRVSPFVGVSTLIVGIALCVGVVYILKNSRLNKIKNTIKNHKLTILDVIPVTSGTIGIDGLVLTDKGMHLMSDKAEKWKVDYGGIDQVDVDVYKMKYTFMLKSGSKKEVHLYPLKDKKDILSTLKNPQLALGGISTIAVPAYASVSALSISAGSARNRVEAMNKKLEAVLSKGATINPSYTGAVSGRDVALGIVLGIEIVALIIVGVILLFPELA